VLAPIKEQENLPLGEVVGQGLDQRPPPPLADPQNGRDRLGDERGVGDWRQIDEPGSVRVRRGQGVERLQGQPGLPAAAGPGQGEDPRLRQEPADLGELNRAAHKAGQLGRQIVGGPGGWKRQHLLRGIDIR
jgi:hypothetical protein